VLGDELGKFLGWVVSIGIHEVGTTPLIDMGGEDENVGIETLKRGYQTVVGLWAFRK